VGFVAKSMRFHKLLAGNLASHAFRSINFIWATKPAHFFRKIGGFFKAKTFGNGQLHFVASQPNCPQRVSVGRKTLKPPLKEKKKFYLQRIYLFLFLAYVIFIWVEKSTQIVPGIGES